MKLMGFNHVGIEVEDLDKAIAFYTEVLGGTLHQRQSGKTPHAFVQVGPDQFVDLVEGKEGPLPHAIHWAFQASPENVDENVEQLQRHEVDMWGPAAHLGGNPSLSWYFLDLDANHLEMHVGYPTREAALKDHVRFGGPELKPRPDLFGGPVIDAQGNRRS